MLKAGLRIHELSPTLAQRSWRLGNFGRSLGRLHAKAATIDRRVAFVGSMNLDPRSAYLNTEVGLAIDSPELVATLSHLFSDSLSSGAYRLRLADDGEHIQWLETAPDGTTVVHDDEPDDRWWWRFKRWLLAPIIGDAML